MTINSKLKLAIQKKGRLTEKSIELLKRCNLEFDSYKDRLSVTARNYSLDILFLRDDDIPEYVQDGVADLGIVGYNVVQEKEAEVEIVKKLGYGKCQLKIGINENDNLERIADLNNRTIATSYPNILNSFLVKNEIEAKVIQISGSVEISPALGISDCICDLVSTGNTLKLHKMKESFTVLDSEAVLIKNKNLEDKQDALPLFRNILERIEAVQLAKKSKYLMMNIPKNNLDQIVSLTPALSSPTILPLADKDKLALHAVIPSDKLWEIQNDLKDLGATGILLLPIENIIL